MSDYVWCADWPIGSISIYLRTDSVSRRIPVGFWVISSTWRVDQDAVVVNLITLNVAEDSMASIYYLSCHWGACV